MFCKSLEGLEPTGLNSRFPTDVTSFSEYIQHMRSVIQQTRMDLTGDMADIIIAANSPAEYIPDKPPRLGVLLIHGLWDCPYTMSDLFRFFQERRCLVRNLLLPGHGTVPGDLLAVTAEEWIKAVEFAVASFAGEVEFVVVAGFSTGANLALLHAIQHTNIAGLILFSPLIAIRREHHPWIKLLARLGESFPSLAWLARRPEADYGKYHSFAYHSIYQAYRLTLKLAKINQDWRLSIPMLMFMTETDEAVSVPAAWRFFHENNHALSQFIYHGDALPKPHIPNAVLRPNAFPESNIVDLSHVSLQTGPLHPHYGRYGDYKDTFHYFGIRRVVNWHYKQPFHYGAVSWHNLLRYHLARLTYNPDFTFTLATIDKFITALQKN